MQSADLASGIHPFDDIHHHAFTFFADMWRRFEIGECSAEIGHECLDIATAAARLVQGILQEHVGRGELVDDAEIAGLSQSKPPIAIDECARNNPGCRGTNSVSCRAIENPSPLVSSDEHTQHRCAFMLVVRSNSEFELPILDSCALQLRAHSATFDVPATLLARADEG